MAQIFISYSKQDIAFALHVRTLLQAAGFEVWLDEKLVPSTQWWRMLERQIKASSALLVIMSPASAESRWVEREILVAENANIPIFPVLLAGEGWSRLADIQYEDMTAGLAATLSERLVNALRASVSGRPIAKTDSQPIKQALMQQVTERRLLEAAMPAETVAGAETELWAKISLPDSPGLRDELPAIVPSGDVIQKGDARTSSFPFRFPIDPATGIRLPVQVTLKASSADFGVRTVGGDDSELIELPPDADSRTVIFTLAPKAGGRTSGRARVLIDLIYEGKVIAQISCNTALVAAASSAVGQYGLWSVPVGTTAASAGGYGAPVAPVAEQPRMAPPSPGPSAWRGEPEPIDDALRGEVLTPKESFSPARPPAPSPAPGQPRTEPAPSSQAVRPRARTISFVTAASAIAALVVVFGIGVLTLNTPGGTTATATNPVIALNSTNTAAAFDLTDIAPEEPTETRAAQIATEQPTTNPNVSAATLTAAVPPLLPTELIIPTSGLIIATSDAGSDPDVPTPAPGPSRQGVAATLLEACATEDEAQALFRALDVAGINYTPLTGSVTDEVVAQLGSSDGAQMVFWGTCVIDGGVTVFAELAGPPTIDGLLHPRTLQFSASDIANPDGPMVAFLRGVLRYGYGWFGDELIDALTVAAQWGGSLESETVVELLNFQSGVADQMHILLAAAYLVNDEDYGTAAYLYGLVGPDSLAPDGYSIAQANLGAMRLNQIVQSVLSEGDIVNDPNMIAGLEAARLALNTAADITSNPAALLQIKINRARLLLLAEAVGGADSAKASEARDLCHALDADYPHDPEPKVCKAAAILTMLNLTGDVCSQPVWLDTAINLINDAALDGKAGYYEYAYWQGQAFMIVAQCAADVDGRAFAADIARSAYQAYLDAVARQVANLAIERAQADVARAALGVEPVAQPSLGVAPVQGADLGVEPVAQPSLGVEPVQGADLDDDAGDDAP